MALIDDSQQKVQAMPLNKGIGATSPYTVTAQDRAIEFLTSASVTLTFADATTDSFTPLAGSRYAISKDIVTTVTTTATFIVG